MTTTTTAAGTYAIGTAEHNGYHDSYFYAVTYTPDTDTFGLIETHSTAYAGFRHITEATPDILDAARTRLVDLLVNANLAKANANRLAPAKGRQVRSLTTRGKNKGITGTVRWMGRNAYGTDQVGISVEGEDGLRYIDANRVEATIPATVDYREIRRQARITAGRARHLGGSSWYYALRDAGIVRPV